MKQVISDAESRMKKSLAAMQEEFDTIRTGRASAALFEKIKVEYYGNPTPLNQVASISIPESRLVVIQPWDKGLLNEIEKAIQKSELSLNPSNDGKVVRLPIPPLTEERRKQLVKKVGQMAEEGRNAVRQIRRDANDQVKKLEKDDSSEVSEDDAHRARDQIQKLTDDHIAKIDELAKKKEGELLEF